MSSVKSIGQRIQFAREFRELDRTTFAKEIGVKYRDILRWETTTHEPRAATLKKMADALNINVNYFLDEEVSTDQIVSYLSEEEMLSESGLGEILAQKRNQIKECIAKTDDVSLLRTISRLMMDYVDAKLLVYLTDVIREYTGYSGEIPEQLATADERRLFIKQMISDIDDVNLLKSTAKVLAVFTRNADVNSQLGTVMTLTNSLPNVRLPGE
ncbi:MAG: helix-turn-helix transcriptional regulator [Solobacterium sp.]|nr:helix-turn-helix transcriptional regulator [Solobacterium sp.]